MKVIIKPRGYGKTTELILIASRTGQPILVATNAMARYVEMKAKDLGFNNILCFSVNDIVALNHKGYEEISKGFLIDEFDRVFEELLRCYGINAVVGTTTLEG